MSSGNDDSKGKKTSKKKETKTGMTCKKAGGSFGDWYSEAVVHGGMIEYYPAVSGCYVLMPPAMAVWNLLKHFFDAEMNKLKVNPYYFPLFVAEAALHKEKHHVEGFAPEVAWVTKSGDSDLESPLAICPTSETIIYPYFAKWIRSYRDLPFRCYQWCNVVREFTNPTPFIRSREFLWQEGHSAFATEEHAGEEVAQILELYRRIYEEFLAVPVIKGRKSEAEKFAGALYTASVEAFVPDAGRGVQAATAHCLGQRFADMFGIRFEDDKGFRSSVWQNSWGYSTRSIGVMVMTHGDDKGLVLPPMVAPIQVVVIPVLYKDADLAAAIKAACQSTVDALGQSGIRAEFDGRENHSPGWKYSHWEMRGVPLRIEIGPKDLANNLVRAVRRDNGAKADVPVARLVEEVRVLLDGIQGDLFRTARERRDACIRVAHTWDEFIAALNDKRLILAPWCDEMEVEKDVKARTTKGEGELGAAKTLCTPFDQPELPEGTLCFASEKPAKTWSFWGRSY